MTNSCREEYDLRTLTLHCSMLYVMFKDVDISFFSKVQLPLYSLLSTLLFVHLIESIQLEIKIMTTKHI